MIGLNIHSVQENNWGYRFIEKSAIDKNRLSSSSDVGIGYLHSFVNYLHLSVRFTNGEGYKKEQEDKWIEFKKECNRIKFDLIQIFTTGDYVDPLMNYFKRREKRI